MSGKKQFITVLLVILAGLSLTGCATLRNIRNITVTSCSVKYLVPTSLRSLQGVLCIGIDNPAMDFTVENVAGVIRDGAKPLAYLSGEDISVAGKQAAEYDVPCKIELAPEVSFLDLLTLAAKGTLQDLKLDVEMQARAGKIARTLQFKDIDIYELSRK